MVSWTRLKVTFGRFTRTIADGYRLDEPVSQIGDHPVISASQSAHHTL
jgi:hypothetical protein